MHTAVTWHCSLVLWDGLTSALCVQGYLVMFPLSCVVLCVCVCVCVCVCACVCVCVYVCASVTHVCGLVE